MHQAYLEVVGQPPKIDLEDQEIFSGNLGESLGDPTALSIIEILADQQGYDNRLDSFRFLRSEMRC